MADKPDSHDICFIPSGDTRAFLGARIGVRPGAVVDADGTVLAQHDGVHGFTVGQRRGLGIAGPGPDGKPRYVTGIYAESGTVRVGDAGDLDVWSLTGQHPVFTSGTAPDGLGDCEVQVRAHGGIAAGIDGVDGIVKMAANSDIKVKIANLGGIPPLILLARNGTAAQKQAALAALKNLSFNADNKAMIAAAGGIPG